MTRIEPISGKTDSNDNSAPRIEVRKLYKIFGGQDQKRALHMARDGTPRTEIHEKTGCTVAVNGIDFQVGREEIFVIMGLSGCGKSTVLRCINQLIEPTSGDVLIDGENVVGMPAVKLRALRREKLGMVFQHFGLLPHRSVIDNAAFGLEIQKCSKQKRLEHARRALELVGLEANADDPITALSGGMQQRVGLARALATDSDILLMDEAFSALDPLIRTEMQDELVSLQERLKKTIVFISHDLDEALRLGDRIAIMKDGRIVQTGSPEEILVNPNNEYIRAFVENVDRSKVLSAESIMQQPTATLSHDCDAETALELFEKHSLESMYVCDDDGRVQGVLNLDDLVSQLTKGQAQIDKLVDRTPNVTSPETPLEELLTQASRTRQPLAVTDPSNRLLGLVTRTAILAAIAKEAKSQQTASRSRD
jgi:glycine betaine/proline transport system ATP-binding protein